MQQLTRDVSDHPSAEYLAAKLSGGGDGGREKERKRRGEGGRFCVSGWGYFPLYFPAFRDLAFVQQ